MINIQNFMQNNNLQYLIVNTTNEFLVEYNTLQENSLYKITGFTGSTGRAVVTLDKIYLIVDGRYHIQADNEVNHDNIFVVKMQTGSSFFKEIEKIIPKNETVGIFSKKNSLSEILKLKSVYKIKLLDTDPYDECEKCSLGYENADVNGGLTTNEKVRKIIDDIGLKDNQVYYLTDLNDVTYIFNKRNYSVPYTAFIKGKAIISSDKALLYTKEKFDDLELFLKKSKSEVFYDEKTINAYDYNLLKKSGCKLVKLKYNPVVKLRTIKNDAETDFLKQAFIKTDKALSSVRDFIYGNDNISEFDIEQKLREEFKNQGAVGLSFKPIIAKDENSALAHYSKSSKDEIIVDGSLVLIDCGAYFDGGLATDITRVFVKGKPSQKQKYIYTLVLKAFLNAFNYLKEDISGFDIDNCAREFFNSVDCKGFVFNHGLGHGIGINVHEAPPNLSSGEIAKTKLQDGMCFTIEPGLYKQGEFGVRLENSCYFKDGNIHSFVNMNYEDKLIDYDMLSVQEKEWLKHFEVK